MAVSLANLISVAVLSEDEFRPENDDAEASRLTMATSMLVVTPNVINLRAVFDKKRCFREPRDMPYMLVESHQGSLN